MEKIKVKIHHGKLSLEKELFAPEGDQLDLDAGAAHRAIDPGVIIIDGVTYYTNQIKDPTTIDLDGDKYLKLDGIDGKVFPSIPDAIRIRGVRFELYNASVQESMQEPAPETAVVTQSNKEQLEERVLIEIRAQIEDELKVRYETKITQLKEEYEGQLEGMVEQVRVLREEMICDKGLLENANRVSEEIVQKQRHQLEEYRKIQEQSNSLPEILVGDMEEVPLKEMVEEIRTLRIENQRLNREYQLKLEEERQSFKRNLEEARRRIDEPKPVLKEEIGIDYGKILGAVAYTLDKLFFSRMISDFKREKMSEFEKDCKRRLEEEVNRSIQWNLTDDPDEYSRIREDFIKERLPTRIEIKAGTLTQDFYDIYMEKEIEKGKVLSILQSVRSNKNFKQILMIDKEILTEFFDSLHIYVLDNVKNGGLSEFSAVKSSSLINKFLLRIYEIMKIKGGVLSYPTFALECYNSISERKVKPIFGRPLKDEDIEKIIELANKDFSGFDNI